MTSPEFSVVHQEIMTLQRVVDTEMDNIGGGYVFMTDREKRLLQRQLDDTVRSKYSTLDYVCEGMPVRITGDGLILSYEASLPTPNELASFNVLGIEDYDALYGLLGEVSVQLVADVSEQEDEISLSIENAKPSVFIALNCPEIDESAVRYVVEADQIIFLALAFPGLQFSKVTPEYETISA